MTSLLQVLWRICTFKAGPDALPDSSFLLVALLFANIIISIVTQLLLTPLIPFPETLTAEQLAELTDTSANIARLVETLATMSLLVWGILSLMNFGPRFSRTLAAILGIDALLTVVALLGLLIVGQLSPARGARLR